MIGFFLFSIFFWSKVQNLTWDVKCNHNVKSASREIKLCYVIININNLNFLWRCYGGIKFYKEFFIYCIFSCPQSCMSRNTELEDAMSPSSFKQLIGNCMVV